MLLKDLLKDYLRFSKKDRIGVIALLLLIAVTYALPALFPRQAPLAGLQIDTALRAIDTKPVEPQGGTYAGNSRPSGFPEASRPFKKFRFDPNTLDEEGWRNLGLPDRVIRTLLNYRSKGGRFKKEEDLQKIWGMPDEVYQRIRGDALFPAEKERPVTQYSNTGTPISYEPGKKRLVIVDVNTADSAAFESLPGIGPKLASRIISFREKLGGFHSVDQVADTWGLPDSTFQRIRPQLQQAGPVRKINLNTASRETMQAHPYIRWKLANAIYSYRAQHGAFGTLDDLKKIMLLSDSAWKKISPYCSVDQ